MKPSLRDLYIAVSICAGLWGTMLLVCVLVAAFDPEPPTPTPTVRSYP